MQVNKTEKMLLRKDVLYNAIITYMNYMKKKIAILSAFYMVQDKIKEQDMDFYNTALTPIRDSVIMDFARLFDPDEQNDSRNFSLRQFRKSCENERPNFFNKGLDKKLDELEKFGKDKCKVIGKIKKSRNKRLAHNDLIASFAPVDYFPEVNELKEMYNGLVNIMKKFQENIMHIQFEEKSIDELAKEYTVFFKIN